MKKLASVTYLRGCDAPGESDQGTREESATEAYWRRLRALRSELESLRAPG